MTTGVLAAIGGTPLVALRRVLPGARFHLFAKLEGLNPGGSIKDRAARQLLQAAIAAGKVGADTVVVESSSGNMGIGLAQACAYFDLRFVCVVDPRTTAQNVAIMRAYGAEIEMVATPDRDGGFLKARIERVRAILAALSDGFWPDQYGNLENARAHRQTMHEIALALGGIVDYLFCPTSTCGTIRGCADYVREHGLPTRIVAVDAVGSVIFADDVEPRRPVTRRLIPGHGAAVRPALYRDGMAARCVRVSDRECVAGCRSLVQTEGMLVGGSAGGALMAVARMADEIEAGANCVAVFPDRGERYLDTIYSDEWVRAHFGEALVTDAGGGKSPVAAVAARGRCEAGDRVIAAWSAE
jgi:N-(2-amino-2-carboxyethyl)-L-glutamate synthase